MSETDQKALRTFGREVREWFDALSTAEKLERLKKSGILDRQGQLSRSYGGDGEATRQEDVRNERPLTV